MAVKSRSVADIASIAAILARWDPVGVIPAGRDGGSLPDEYDEYAPHILGMLHKGSTVGEVAARLEQCRTGSMGLEPDPAADRRYAAEILAWWRTAKP
jgi:hypothetical protein